MTDDPSTDDTERSLNVGKKNGVYLLAVHSEFEGYTVRAGHEQVWAESVTINGQYVGTSEYFETECDDFEIDGDTVHLLYDEKETAVSGTNTDQEDQR